MRETSVEEDRIDFWTQCSFMRYICVGIGTNLQRLHTMTFFSLIIMPIKEEKELILRFKISFHAPMSKNIHHRMKVFRLIIQFTDCKKSFVKVYNTEKVRQNLVIFSIIEGRKRKWLTTYIFFVLHTVHI